MQNKVSNTQAANSNLTAFAILVGAQFNAETMQKPEAGPAEESRTRPASAA